MIQKIKDALLVKEQLAVLKNEVIGQAQTVAGFKEEMQEFKESFEEVKTAQREILQSLKNDIPSLKASREALEKEVYDFKLLKSQLQNNLLKKFEEELEKELQVNTSKIQEDLKDFESMHEKVSALVSKTDSVSGEIDKFTEISSKIKKGDFDLSKFARDLEKSDGEKLMLMKKIDTLERLLAKMRRR